MLSTFADIDVSIRLSTSRHSRCYESRSSTLSLFAVVLEEKAPKANRAGL